MSTTPLSDAAQAFADAGSLAPLHLFRSYADGLRRLGLKLLHQASPLRTGMPLSLERLEKFADVEPPTSLDLSQAPIRKGAFHLGQQTVLQIAQLEEVVATLYDWPASAKLTAIREWADVLRAWPDSKPPTLPTGTARFSTSRGTHRISDENVDTLNQIVATGQCPRLNALRAGVVDPAHRTSPSKEPFFDARLPLIAEGLDMGWTVPESVEVVTGWLRGLWKPPQFESVVRSPGLKPERLRPVAGILGQMILDEFGRGEQAKLRLGLAGPLRWLDWSSEEQVRGFGILVCDRRPWEPELEDVPFTDAVDVMQRLRGLLQPKKLAATGLQVVEEGPARSRRFDLALEWNGIGLHAWVQQVPAIEWGSALLWHGSPQSYLSRLALTAYDRGRWFAPRGLWDRNWNRADGQATTLDVEDGTCRPGGGRAADPDWSAQAEQRLLQALGQNRWEPRCRAL